MTRRQRLIQLLPFGLLTLLFGVRLWMASPMQMIARQLPRDDLLYVRLATSIAKGEWLGPYNSLIMTKSPGYPLWLAFENLTGLPPMLTEHALFFIAILILFVSLVRVGFPPLLSACGLSVLIFSPDSFNIEQFRLSRVFLYDALTLLLVALFIYSFTVTRWRSLIIISLAGGLILALYSLIREEYVWMIPAYAVYAVMFYIYQRRHLVMEPLLRVFVAAALPWVLVLAADAAVKEINYRYYGVRIVHDQRDGNFPKAMGALARIKAKDARRFVPISREARLIAYDASPAFAELEPRLERGILKENALKESCQAVRVCTDMTAGWVYWAIRDVVLGLGYYQNALSAEEFYGRIANEINSACDSKKITCGPPHASLLPVFHTDLIRPWLNAIGDGLPRLVRPPFLDDNALAIKSWWLTKDSINVKNEFRALFPDVDIFGNVVISEEDRQRLRRAGALRPAWRWLVILCPLAGLGYFAHSLRDWRRNRTLDDKRLFVIAASAIFLIGVAARVAVLGVVHITLFPAFGHYFMPAYSLMAAYCAFILIYSADRVLRR